MNPFIKYAGVFEVVAVFLVGSVIASVLYQLAGITGHPLMALTEANPDMFGIGIETGKILLLQYAGFLSLAAIFTFCQRQHVLKDRGFTLNGYSVVALLAMGFLGWTVGDLLHKVLWIIDAEFDLGQSAPWREALFNAEATAGWWFLLFVGSFGLVPILEEIFWRGYVQGRLQQFLSPTAAIVLSSVMFTLSHGQYHQFDFYHLSTILSVFFSSCAMGWLYYKTRSLIPAIVLHALLNFPVFGVWSYVVLAVMLVLIAVYWKVIRQELVIIKQTLKRSQFGLAECCAGLFLGLCMLALTQWQAHLQTIGWLSLVVTLVGSAWFNWQIFKQKQQFS